MRFPFGIGAKNELTTTLDEVLVCLASPSASCFNISTKVESPTGGMREPARAACSRIRQTYFAGLEVQFTHWCPQLQLTRMCIRVNIRPLAKTTRAHQPPALFLYKYLRTNTEVSMTLLNMLAHTLQRIYDTPTNTLMHSCRRR